MSGIQEQVRLHLSSLIAAKQQALKPLKVLRDSLSSPDSDLETAKAFVREVCRNEDTIGRQDTKDLVTPVALTHKIECNVGDYGNGEFLILENDNWYRGEVGDWISSSESC